MIVDDPKKGIVEGNIKEHRGQGVECQHLIEEEPGKFSCAVHDESWYKKTPCFSHGQIEQSVEDVCRLGEYILKQKLKLQKGKDRDVLSKPHRRLYYGRNSLARQFQMVSLNG